MSAAKLMARLTSVRETGPSRWIARCPAHEDHSPSLSIRELDDGRVLLHDFGGCGAADVLDAIGLKLADLFPAPLSHHIQQTRSRIPAGDLLALIDFETLVVYIVAGDMRANRHISEIDFKRLAVAVHRIGEARNHALG